MSTWEDRLIEARQQGYSWDEIGAFAQKKRDEAKAAGYTDEQINAYMGLKPSDDAGLADTIHQSASRNFPSTEDGSPRVASSLKDYWTAGWQISATQIVQKKPDVVLPENAGVVARLMSGLGTLTGDLPVSIIGGAAATPAGAARRPGGDTAAGTIVPGAGNAAGAAVGTGVGGAAGFGFGAMAAPEFIRKLWMDRWEKGAATTPGDFMQRVMSATWEASKMGFVGAATGGAGKAVRVAAPIVNLGKREAAALATEFGTMTTASSAIQGQLPTKETLIDSVLLMGALHVAGGGAKMSTDAVKFASKNLMQYWAKTGEAMPDIVQRAQRDPAFRERILAGDVKVDKTAAETGHTIDAYHGTAKEFTQFDMKAAGENSGAEAAKKAIFFSSDPRIASDYAFDAAAQSEGAAANVRPAKLKIDNPLVVDMKGGHGGGAKMNAYIIRAQQMGHDGVIFKNIRDGMSAEANREPTTVYAVFDNAQVRSRFEAPVEAMTDVEPRPTQYAMNPSSEQSKALVRSFIKEVEGEVLPPEGKPGTEVAAAGGGKGGKGGPPGPPAAEEPFSPRQPDIRPVDMEALKRVRAQIGETKEPPGATFRELFNRLYTEMIDERHPLVQMAKAIAGDDKAALTEAGRVENLSRLTEGSQGRAEAAIQFGVRDAGLNKISKGLDEIVGKMSGAERKEFETFAVAFRDLELTKKRGGKVTAIDTQDAATAVKILGPKYSQPLKDLIHFQNSVLKELLDSGIVSAERFNEWTQANQLYVPFYRLFDDALKGKGVGRGKQAFNPVKELFGSERQIAPPLESIIKNTLSYLTLADRNRANLALVDFALKNQDQKNPFVVRRPKGFTERPLSAEELGALRGRYGDETAAAMNTDFARYRSLFRSLGNDDILVYRDGKAEVYTFPTDVAKFLKGMDKPTMGLWAKMMEPFARIQRTGVTISPDFAVRQIFKDEPWQFIFNTREDAASSVKALTDFWSGIPDVISKNEAYKKALASGVLNSTVRSIGDEYLKSGILTRYKETDFLGGVRNIVSTPYHLLEMWSDLQANAGRVGEFKRIMKAGGDPLDAITAARQSRLDFKRLGTQARILNRLIPFFGPALNGMDRSVRAMAKDPVGVTAKAAAIVTVPVLLNWWLNKDEEWYQELPAWQKDLTLPMKIGDTIWRIPLPPVAGVLFGAAPRRMMEQLVRDNPRAWDDYFESVALDFTPAAQFAFFLPIVEHMANYSFFTNSPIVPNRVEKTLAPEQYTDYSTETAKAISRFLSDVPLAKDFDLSAPIIENYVRNWTGSMGSQVLTLSDKALIASGLIEDPVKPEDTMADIPFIRSFVVRYPSSRAEDIQRFYDNYEKQQKVLGSLKVVKSELAGGYQRAPDRMTELMTEHGEALVKLQGIKSAMDRQTKLIHDTYNNRGMSPRDKRQLIDQAYSTMIVESRLGNELVDGVNTALGEAK